MVRAHDAARAGGGVRRGRGRPLVPESALELAKIRYERGDLIKDIAIAVGCAATTLGHHGISRKWIRPWANACRHCGGPGPFLERNGKQRKTCLKCERERGRLKSKRRTAEERQEQKRREYARKGKIYWPRGPRGGAWWMRLGRGYGKAVNLKAHGWRSRSQRPTVTNSWLERLRTELPHLYDPAVPQATLVYRARYNLDHEYKAKEIRRSHKRRSDEEHRLFVDDGTLTGAILRRLYSVRRCPYCGKPMRSTDKSLDHVWCRSLGGWHSASNAVVCCRSCNSRKLARSPRRWLATLPEGKRVSVLKLWRKVGVNVDQGYLVG